MKKRKFTAVFLAAALLLTAGCGAQFESSIPGAAQPLETGEEDLVVVGVSQVGSESVWRTANSASIKDVFTKENGYLLIFDNARQKQENQIKAIRSFISQQVDYIVFSPIMENGWETVLQEAKDAGIPVILMDRMVKVEDESLYTAWVGSNFEEEGKKAGEWLFHYLEEQGRAEEETGIVVLKGTEGSTSTIGRTQGFNAVAEQHENWKILEQADAEFTTAKGHEEMERMLKEYQDIDVVVSQNDDMTFGALEALWEAGLTTGADGEVTVISFDAVKAALVKVQEGSINIDVECNPEQAPYISQVIQKLENGEETEKFCYVPEKIFTRENVGQFLEERTY